MGFRRFGTAEVLSVHVGGQQAPALVRKQAHRAVFSFDPRDGYVYVRSRAISSRCNDNFDQFGADEIEKSYRTFLGKPVFVNHSNSNHHHARGVIIDAALHRDRNPDGSPDTWAEVLMEVDGRTYPKLAQALVNGDIDRTSMGVDVQISKCSGCGNEARNPSEYCKHIPAMKGKTLVQVGADGRRTAKLIYEECRGLSFFENSLLVEPPADPTAWRTGPLVLGPGLEHLSRATRLIEAAVEPDRPPAAATAPARGLQRIASRRVGTAHSRPNRFGFGEDVSVPLPDPRGQLELRRHLMDVHGYERDDIGMSPRAEHDRAHSGEHGDYWMQGAGSVDTEMHHHHPVDHLAVARHYLAAAIEESLRAEAVATDAHVAMMSPSNLYGHLHSIEDDPRAQAGGMSWYHHLHQISQALSDIHNAPIHKVAAVIAAYSPKTAPAPNLSSAISALSNGEAATPENHAGPMSLGLWKGPRPKVNAIFADKDFDPDHPEEFFHRHLGHVKTANFGLNIYAPHDPRFVTTDVHHSAALAGHQGISGEFEGSTFDGGMNKDGTPSAGQRRYDKTVEMTHQATDALNHHPEFKRFRKSLDHNGLYLPINHDKLVLPSQTQALVWGVQRGKSTAAMEPRWQKGQRTSAQRGVDKLQDHYLHRDSPFSMLHPDNWKSVFGAIPHSMQEQKTAGQERPMIRLAYNETRAPQDVDTLRDEACPICGNDIAFDGTRCQVCDYIRPPKGLDDPDVSKAKELDSLKQGLDEEMNASGADPSRPGAPFDAGDVDQIGGPDDSASPWLECTNCGTGLRPTAPQTTGDQPPGAQAPPGPAEGDVCPVCQKGELAPSGESEDETDEQAEGGQAPPGEEDDASDEDEEEPPDDDEDEDDEEEDEVDPRKNPASRAVAAVKYRDHQKEHSMQNALASLAAMQETISRQATLIDHQQRTIASLHTRAGVKDSQVRRLTAGLQAVAQLLGPQADTIVRTAMVRKQADEQNPAQPIPEPAPQPPTQTSVDAKTPEAFADVRAPGMIPGSNQDVAADAVTTAYTPGQDIGTPPVRQLVDVTAPVDGTQGPRPLSETKTNVDVRAGNPMNPQVAYPLNGPFANAQRTGAAEQNDLRTMASIRLARLRLTAGIEQGRVEQGDDLTVGQRIASDPLMSMDRINHEIATLNQVRTASAQSQAAMPPRGAVPRPASPPVQRLVPPLGSGGGFQQTASLKQREDDELADALI